jgi:hypothetical protein
LLLVAVIDDDDDDDDDAVLSVAQYLMHLIVALFTSELH